MESTIIYGKNAVIEALEAGEREFNKINAEKTYDIFRSTYI